MYAIWDTETANVLGMYSSEAAALRAVAGLLDANGTDFARDMALVREDRSGVPTAIDTGYSLATRALVVDRPRTNLLAAVTALDELFSGTHMAETYFQFDDGLDELIETLSNLANMAPAAEVGAPVQAGNRQPALALAA